MPHDFITSFYLALAVSLFAYWLVKLIRGFKFVQPNLIDGIKPWACNVCMSFWTTMLLIVGMNCTAYYIIEPRVTNCWLLVSWAEALGLCTLLLEHTPDRVVKL